jgi:hypothetical protein
MSAIASQPPLELCADAQPDSPVPAPDPAPTTEPGADAARRRFAGSGAGPKTEPGKDAGSKLYSNTARPEDTARRRFAGSGLALEERIGGVWEALITTGMADCPVCRGRMERAAKQGICTSCGSILR